METIQTPNVVSAPPRRWPLFVAGILLFLLGPAINVVQLSMGHMPMPWDMPVLASIGVLLMAVSVWQRRGVLRSVGLGLFVLVCGLEWFFVLVVAKTPPYTGRAQPGSPVPAFATTLADGGTFTNADLESGKPAVLVFFRGHW